MHLIKHGRDIANLSIDKIPIIWGMGNMGNRFCMEVFHYTDRKLLVYDKNNNLNSMYGESIDYSELVQVVRTGMCVVIISIQNDEIVKDIVDTLNKLNSNIELYRYIPENRKDISERERKVGFFNGREFIHILGDEEAVQLMKKRIMGVEPFLFSRWGSVEGEAVYQSVSGDYSHHVLDPLINNAGVFPYGTQMADKFTNIMKLAADNIDLFCVGYWCPHIDELFRMYSPKAILLSSTMIYPFFENSWTQALKNMKVLVIHPFADLIEKQYCFRKNLFNNEILPEFDLIPYKAVQSIGGNDEYRDWCEVLEKMEEDIANVNFDIALIGCGAYGMPLGAFIKSKLHKKAIHMGGSLQILFGIKGARWEGDPYNYDIKLYNDYWIRPGEELRPKGWKKVENGCYW